MGQDSLRLLETVPGYSLHYVVGVEVFDWLKL